MRVRTRVAMRAQLDSPDGEPTIISMRPSVGSASGMSMTLPPMDGILPMTVSTALPRTCLAPSTLICTRCGLASSSGTAETT